MFNTTADYLEESFTIPEDEDDLKNIGPLENSGFLFDENVAYLAKVWTDDCQWLAD